MSPPTTPEWARCQLRSVEPQVARGAAFRRKTVGSAAEVHTLSSAPLELLPTRLWAAGNLYRVFGRAVHLCYADGGHRTVEIDGREVARSRHVSDPALHNGPAGDAGGALLFIDLGWIAVGIVAVGVTAAVIANRVRR